jgi:hypothetical protein
MNEKKLTDDQRRALEILAEYGEQADPHASTGEREAAAEHVLDELVGLDGQAHVRAQRRPGEAVAVRLAGGGNLDVFVGYDSGALFVRAPQRQREAKVPVVFNRVAGKLESTEVETDLVPIPGEPAKRRRDALVAVADAIVAVLRAE